MSTSQMSAIIQYLHRAMLLRDGAGLSDGQLLTDYISRRDERAFAALVRRHGPMVWGVCRRVLRNHHDAEDAFQATFLVLVRKAASIASRELVANWLYGVAHQTALKARATAAKKTERERQVAEMPEPAVTQQGQGRDLQPLLDEELNRLPDKYRGVIVLCDLEGKTRKEAARQLGCPEGTVAGRLARARTMLAKRLSRHGLAVSGGALTAMLLQQMTSTYMPPTAACSTIETASLFATGQATATEGISLKVAALTEGVLRTMLLTKLKMAVGIVLVFALMGTGATVLTSRRVAAQSDKPPVGMESLVLKRGKGNEKPKTRSTGAQNDKPAPEITPKRAQGIQSVWTLESSQKLVPAGMEEQATNEEQGNKKPSWDLGFRFKNPRLATLRLPAKGGKAITVWYWWYEVSNNTPQSHTFVPAFEIMSSEKVYHDEVRAGLTEGIRRIEDPINTVGIKNSVTIAHEPIPPTKSVTGIAIWGHGDPDAADAKTFTIFVAGLSNEWSISGDTVWRKVLKVNFKRLDNEMIPTGPAEWVYRSSNVKRAEGNKAKSDHAEPLGHIVRITRQGDKVYINLGKADKVRPKLTFSVYGIGSYHVNHRPKASLEVLTILQAHLSLAQVTWLHDPVREPLVEGDQLFNSESDQTQGGRQDEKRKQQQKQPSQRTENQSHGDGVYNGDKDVQELIHKYRSLSDKDKLGQEGNRIKERILLLSQREKVALSPFTRDTSAGIVAEHLLRGDLQEAKNKQVDDAVKRAVEEVRAEQIRLIAENAKAQREELLQKLREKEEMLLKLRNELMIQKSRGKDKKEDTPTRERLEKLRKRMQIEKELLTQQATKDVKANIDTRIKQLVEQLEKEGVDKDHAKMACLDALEEIEKTVKEMKKAKQKKTQPVR